MPVEINVTDEFREWYEGLTKAEQNSVEHVVDMLRAHGVSLRFPHSSAIVGSKVSAMRELRIQHAGEPYRVLYAFDPKRQALLLVGGNKTGDERWYEGSIRLAERLWDEYLRGV